MSPDSEVPTVPAEVVAVAVRAVRSASRLCASVQGRLVDGDTVTKSDDSPATVADFAAQAIVCAELKASLGDVAVVGEEDPADLTSPEQQLLFESVVELVRRERRDRIAQATVLEWISIGSAEASGGAYWTLDPIDGTKGFLRGDQFAIALALIESGRVVLGVLACPNLPNRDGSTGAVFTAVHGEAVMYCGASGRPLPVRVAEPATLAEARFCESVESGHSDQSQSAEIARLLGIGSEPYRIDSQCKYGAVARGDASIYLRLPVRADYVEKIWDHAAGHFVVEQAGGRVTDVRGEPLDFGRGSLLRRNSGVVATAGRFHDEVLAAAREVLGL